MAFTALYDACVLYPAPLRDLLVQLACTNLFRARWTDRIQAEWTSNLLVNRPDLSPDTLSITVGRMNEAVEDCLVAGYEALADGLALPDPDDRHVLASAIAGQAGVIVTFNLKDFPAKTLEPFGIEAQHPDEFIRHVLDLDRQALMAVRMCRSRLRAPPKTVEEYLGTLAQQGLPETVQFLREWIAYL